MRDLFETFPGLRWLKGVRAPLTALALCGSALPIQGESITTTIYVGRHFEVRGHDQPTKYVFNGATRVAEVTGSISASLRIQRLRFYPGWNLCSLAVSGPFPASGAETIAEAYRWNPGTGDYSKVTLGQMLGAGTVLWVKAETNVIASALGAYNDPTPQQHQAGGTYVSGTGLETWSPALADSMSAWDYDAPTAQWLYHLMGGLAAASGPAPFLSPGGAFYLQASALGSLDIPDPTLRIRYYHQDHLGSSSAITDANGVLVEETAFYPFGVPRNEFRLRQVAAPYQFTQKERDHESGLHYFEARYLAGPLSRFVTADMKYANPEALSPDDFGSFLVSPQKMNLYAYVLNNPITLVDPSGMDGQKPPPTKTLVVYGGDMFEDFQRTTKINDRAMYEKALKAAYKQEAGDNADITIRHIESKKDLEKALKGSSYANIVINSHGYLNKKGLILGLGKEGDVTPEDLARSVSGAKTAPQRIHIYGCNTAKTGFASDLSGRLTGTEITGSTGEIAQDYKFHTKGGKISDVSIQENRDYNQTYRGGEVINDARKVDLNDATPLR